MVGNPAQFGRHLLRHLLRLGLHARMEDVQDEVFLLGGIKLENVRQIFVEERVMSTDKLHDANGAGVGTCRKACMQQDVCESDQCTDGMFSERPRRYGRCGHVQWVAQQNLTARRHSAAQIELS